MTLANRWPQTGDSCVDFRAAARSWESDSVGDDMTVKTITQTLIITSTGAKYHKGTLTPHNEGPHSARRLVPPHDPRVLCVRGRGLMAELARQVENLAKLQRKDPADIVGDFARIISAAAEARKEYVKLTSAASRAEQESDR